MFLRKIAAPSGGYSVGKSLRFRSSASAYLSRTIGSPSTTTNTFSVWLKRGSTINTAYNFILGCSSTNSGIDFQNPGTSSNDTIQILDNGTSYLITNAVYRDPSAWYHIVVVWDSTNATASNRVRLYVNGSQVTSFSTANYPAQNTAFSLFTASTALQIGSRQFPGALYFDGYMAEINFIDGQALTASSFGAYDTNGVWQPAKYSGTYGTNGFYLTFGNTTSTATLGNDSSGNSNTWTVNNISLTAGVTYDSMTDSPTVTSASVANYAVLNPLNTGGTLSSGNLGGTGSGFSGQAGTIAMSSGKWYWEVSSVYNMVGLALSTWKASGGVGGGADSWGYITNGNKYNNGSQTSYGATYSNTDVIGVAFDANAGTLTFYKNNVSQGTAFSGLTSGPYVPAIGYQNTSGNITYINFGQQPFTYTAPTGFAALNTYNLPTPTITNGAKYMAATLYTGTGASNSINNGNNNTIGTTFQPDWVWIKSRSAATDHKLTDSVRGVTKAIITNSTAAETTDTNGLTAFGSTGFTLGTDTIYNNSGATYVGWQWKAAGSTASNTNGSITSTVSANTTAGFSVVTYTGNGTTSASVGHGLGATPSLIFIKRRDTTAQDWGVYNVSGGLKLLQLNTTNAYYSSGVNYWYSLPTSSVFYPDNTAVADHYQNVSGATYVAYCWAAIAGYSAFGSYTGNGSTDGTFVYTGFRPRWMLIKASSGGTGSWLIVDTSISPYNVATDLLKADLANAEVTTYNGQDTLSNGFKFRGTGSEYNGSGVTYIYAAFAENPFNSSRAR